MSTIEQSIEVNVPLGTAYDQWTQFEQFPQFMEGVDEVRRLDATHLHWVASIGGHQEEWDAEVTDQSPNRRVAWQSTSGKQNTGEVRFDRIDDSTTRVTVQMEFEAEGLVEKAGAAIGAPDRRVKGDLERYKELIESRGADQTLGTIGSTGSIAPDAATDAIDR